MARRQVVDLDGDRVVVRRPRARRRTLDAYMTPYEAFFVDQLMRTTPITGHVVECCSGDGKLAAAIRANMFVRAVTTNDIDGSRAGAAAVAASLAGRDTYEVPHYGLDASRKDTFAIITRERGPIDWVVTNPPFSKAIEIVTAALAYAKVAMLLRLSFLEPTIAREEFLNTCPPSKIHIMPRTSFTSDGKTDSVTVMWAVWDWTSGSVSVSPRRETWDAMHRVRRR